MPTHKREVVTRQVSSGDTYLVIETVLAANVAARKYDVFCLVAALRTLRKGYNGVSRER
jgi:hypothetical protein